MASNPLFTGSKSTRTVWSLDLYEGTPRLPLTAVHVRRGAVILSRWSSMSSLK